MANVVVIAGALVLALLWSLLQGGIYFILTAAVTGFVSWLANASDPRGLAITVGLGTGSFVTFVAMITRVRDGVDAYQQEVARVKRLTGDE